jgi:TonB family protein
MVRGTSAVLWVIGAAGVATLNAQAQEPLAHIRELYSNAAYEDVLSALAVDAAVPPPEVGQYKVFSLIALGRPNEAEKAAEAVIIANPRFQPDRDASPRVLDLFVKVRKRIAPDLLKSMYINAKSALDRKDRDAAIREFSDVVSVTEDPDLKDDPTVSELHLLASGFLDLSRAMPVGPSAAGREAGSDPVATPSASQPAQMSVATIPKITLPVPIQEAIPRWEPPTSYARIEYRGAVLVRIDSEGKVVSSEILTPTHPMYDSLLLRASRTWTYKPASNNGVAIPSERIINVILKPRLEE